MAEPRQTARPSIGDAYAKWITRNSPMRTHQLVGAHGASPVVQGIPIQTERVRERERVGIIGAVMRTHQLVGAHGASTVVQATRIQKERARERERVGIIGAGMSGLYAGLLLKKNRIPFHILEGRKERVGGRIYTYRQGFGPGENQYFEAGAMRLPRIPSQKPVFYLITYLNKQSSLPPGKQIELIKYHYKDEEGNLVYVNGRVQSDGKLMTLKYANDHPEELGFEGLKPVDAKRTADSLMDEVMIPLLDEYQRLGPDKFFRKYDHMSLRYYLANYATPKWYHAKINYAEVMTSGTNAFTYGVVESVIEYDDFNSQESLGWSTIKNGMCRLPEACATVIGKENITMGALVYKIDVEGGKVAVTYSTDGCVPSRNPKIEKFDKLLVAVPPPVIRVMERPRWSSGKEEAIRACNIQPTYKLGMQFKTRFWENPKKVEHPTFGGQSTTDLPSRWIVYPSYGIGDNRKGVLLVYSWSTDALNMVPATDEQRKSRALLDLQKLYPEVDISSEFTGEYQSINWATEWSTGVADFLPGQFSHLLPYLKQPEGNIYFAGEHISTRHGWIVGALDSALNACIQMFPDTYTDGDYLK